MRNQYFITIDKLKLCYTASDSQISELKDINKYEGNGYRLTSIPSDKQGITTLAVDILWDDTENEGLRYYRFAHLTIGDTFKEENANYVWLSIENRMFYETLYPSTSLQIFAPIIADDLGLKFHNFTHLDIAIDTDAKDYIKRIRKYIKKYTPIVANKAYPNLEEEINTLKYISTGNRIKITNTSIYVDIENAALSVYNKTRELKEKKKEYINFNTDKDITRLEVRLNNKAIKEYMAQQNQTLDELYNLICRVEDEAVLITLFRYYSNRLIRFRDNNKSIVSILDLPR